MANYNKTFNFKNGVQVDVDKFIVRGSLVGIGTSIPGEILDVNGNIRVSGLVTTSNLNVSGVATFNQVRVGAVQLSASAGVVTATAFYGNGATLSNLPTSQWVDVDVGLGFTSIYAAGNVGVNTLDPRFSLQIGANPLNNLPGVGINSNGNIITTGIVSAISFVGAGYALTSLNASNITQGQVPASVIPTYLYIGVVTATSFYGNLIGIAATAQGLTGNPNISVSNVTSSNVNNTGILTSVVLSGTYSNVGISTVSTRLYAESVGVGTNSPSSDIHIRRTSQSKLQVTSDSAEAIVALGKSTTLTGYNGILRFGNTSTLYPYSTPSSLDIINYAVGNVNSYLSLGSPGFGTGSFNWLYGASSSQLMSLTYDGKLGIGISTPINTLHVVGVSTVAGDSYVSGNLYVNTNANITGSLTIGGATIGAGGVLNNNLNATSGVTTVTNLNVYSPIGAATSIGLGTSKPAVGLDAQNDTAYFSNLGVSTTALFNGATTFAVDGFSQLGAIGIGTTTLYNAGLYGQVQLHGTSDFDSSVALFGSQIAIDQFSTVGFNTYYARSILDFGVVGSAATIGYFIPPTLTATQRTALGVPVAGGAIYNSTTATPQYYNGTRWFDVTSTDGNSANAGFSTFARWAGISTIASVAGFSSVSIQAGVSTIAAVAGFATNATRAGVATFSTLAGSAGFSTVASVAGFATVATQAGISTSVLNGVANVTALNVSPGISTVGLLTASSAIYDVRGNVRTLQQNAQVAAYVATTSDVGKHISITTGGVTINADTFSIGDMLVIYNNSDLAQTISRQNGTITFRKSGTSGSQTSYSLAARGVMNLLCVATNEFVAYSNAVT